MEGVDEEMSALMSALMNDDYRLGYKTALNAMSEALNKSREESQARQQYTPEASAILYHLRLIIKELNKLVDNYEQ
jgi:hypothetical protein